MPRRKKNARGVRKYDDGGSASPVATTSSSSPSSYYSMLANLGGSLGGSRQSPFNQGQGGNPYFRKGGKVGARSSVKGAKR